MCDDICVLLFPGLGVALQNSNLTHNFFSGNNFFFGQTVDLFPYLSVPNKANTETETDRFTPQHVHMFIPIRSRTRDPDRALQLALLCEIVEATQILKDRYDLCGNAFEQKVSLQCIFRRAAKRNS